MSALGDNPFFKKNNDVSQLVNSSQKNENKNKNTRSAKYTDEEIEKLETIMIALGSDKISTALKYCISVTWAYEGETIQEIAQKKRELDLQTKELKKD
jgi:hypothetical protein